jgi:predicted regulator of Ras-like GTPase activity (Roadblock/LC7/MglB family)
MQTMADALVGVTGLRTAARADRTGNVEDSAGPDDAETLCAVAAMCNAQVEAIGDLLGAGAMLSWSILTDRSSLYLQTIPGGFVTAIGEPAKAPEAVLRAFSRKLEGK